jgi:hypothetical protein
VIFSETREVIQGMASNPVRSLPARDLVTQGFIRPDEEGHYDYYGPDAKALLSEDFLDTHCFRIRSSADAQDLLGVSFEPARMEGPPDISGTIWLDREKAKLRFLEFRYEWSPWAEAAGVAMGRVDFLELPTGAWIIPRWWIRMPTVIEDRSGGGGAGGIIRLTGAREVGWESVRVSDLYGSPVSPPSQGSITGRLRIGDSEDSLPTISVLLHGASLSTAARADGQFSFEGVPEGGYRLSPHYPLLDSLGLTLRGTDIDVRPGRTPHVDLEVLPRQELIRAACGTSPEDPPEDPPVAVLTGTLRRHGSGEPLPEAEVILEWWRPTVWIFKRRVQAVAFPDAAGRYRACGFPADTRVRVRGFYDGARTSLEEFRASPGEIVVLDLTVRAPGPGSPS